MYAYYLLTLFYYIVLLVGGTMVGRYYCYVQGMPEYIIWSLKVVKDFFYSEDMALVNQLL